MEQVIFPCSRVLDFEHRVWKRIVRERRALSRDSLHLWGTGTGEKARDMSEQTLKPKFYFHDLWHRHGSSKTGSESELYLLSGLCQGLGHTTAESKSLLKSTVAYSPLHPFISILNKYSVPCWLEYPETSLPCVYMYSILLQSWHPQQLMCVRVCLCVCLRVCFPVCLCACVRAS